MIRADLHTHHERCGHARGAIREYVEAALALGFDEVGISDHAPIYWLDGDHPLPHSAMPKSRLPEYVEEVLELKKQYRGRIRVLLGLESDYAPGFDDAYRELFAQYPFDYVIGSVHYSDGLHIYQQSRWHDDRDPEPVYREYFRLVRESARSGLFDVLGHITAIMTLGPKPAAEVIEDEFEKTAGVIAESGVAVEVNASGIRKGTGAPYPHPDLLFRCVEAGVPLTYGSDSHRPEEVGHGWDVAVSWLGRARHWRPGARAAGAFRPKA